MWRRCRPPLLLVSAFDPRGGYQPSWLPSIFWTFVVDLRGHGRLPVKNVVGGVGNDTNTRPKGARMTLTPLWSRRSLARRRECAPGRGGCQRAYSIWKVRSVCGTSLDISALTDSRSLVHFIGR